MELVLLAVIAGLLIDRYLQGRANRNFDARLIDFTERHSNRMATQLEESRAQVSEMANRIQHPHLLRPDVRPGDVTKEMPPTYEDDFERVGGIYEQPSERNGD